MALVQCLFLTSTFHANPRFCCHFSGYNLSSPVCLFTFCTCEVFIWQLRQSFPSHLDSETRSSDEKELLLALTAGAWPGSPPLIFNYRWSRLCGGEGLTSAGAFMATYDITISNGVWRQIVPPSNSQHCFNFKVVAEQPQCRGGCFQIDAAVSGFLSRARSSPKLRKERSTSWTTRATETEQPQQREGGVFVAHAAGASVSFCQSRCEQFSLVVNRGTWSIHHFCCYLTLYTVVFKYILSYLTAISQIKCIWSPKTRGTMKTELCSCCWMISGTDVNCNWWKLLH